jgi:hypothetical protein
MNMNNVQSPGLIPRMLAVLTSLAMLTVGADQASAKNAKQLGGVNLVPTITNVSVNDAGQLVAAGNINAIVKGKRVIAPFSDVPVSLAVAADQTGAGECPILDLQLGPITLDLLGLVVETSPICLKITAYDGGGLLGDLLCSISDLLNGGALLPDILGTTLTTVQLNTLLGGLENLLNAALGNLVDAILANIQEQSGRTCAILNLELGPVNLTLLGLNVHLDDCNDGPVTVDITAVRGRLLGNLLCGLLHGGGLGLGDILGDIINGLVP